MALPDIAETVKEIMARELSMDVASVGEETAVLNNPLWDSVKHVDIVFALQDAFGIEFEQEETEEMFSYPDIVNMLHRKLGGAVAADSRSSSYRPSAAPES